MYFSESHYTLSDLADRGWTPSAIRDFLSGGPDMTTENPFCHFGSRVQLYFCARVETMEARKDFQAWKAEQDKRSAAARVATLAQLGVRKQKHLEWARTVEVEVFEVSWETLKEAANSKNKGHLLYARGEHTDWEWLLSEASGKPGASAAKQIIRSRVLRALASKFPKLEAAARRQALAWFDRKGEVPEDEVAAWAGVGYQKAQIKQ